jgi:signal transduction histidine kinase
MRFDDRLTTVMAGDVPTGTAAVAQYRQLVDILGQIAGDDVDALQAPALARVHALRNVVSDDERLLTVQCLSGRLVSPVLVQYLAAERPPVASAAIRAARLTDEQWAGLVPALPTRARGFLRHRRDLGPRTRALLDQLGLYDTALPDAIAPAQAVVGETHEPVVEDTQEPQPVAGISQPDPEVVAAAEPNGLAVQEPEAVMLAEAAVVTEPEPAPQAPPATREGPQSIGEIVKRIEALQEVRFRQAMDVRSDFAGDGWNELDKAMQPAVSVQPQVPEARFAAIEEPRSEVAAPVPDATEAAEAAKPPEHEHFTFSTGVDGAITAAKGMALGAVYGLSIGVPALAGSRGVDAAVATAFSRRVPMRGGRADLGNAASLRGEWRIDADPVFDRATGRFTGYHGVIRRPMAWESAGSEGETATLAGRDGLRQIVHELRTPLNAIMGFSEIIEQQLFGPVAAEYRDMALRIRQDARTLLTGFDDLDTALRLDRNAIDDPAGVVSIDDLVSRLKTRVQPLLDHSGASLSIGPVPQGCIIAMSVQALDRIVPRLAGALIGSCAPGETLAVSFALQATALDMHITRPQSLSGLDEDSLFDVDRADEGQGQGGPLLGLGFCLRLVRNLLSSHGGQMAVEHQALCLTLPRVQTSAEIARS